MAVLQRPSQASNGKQAEGLVAQAADKLAPLKPSLRGVSHQIGCAVAAVAGSILIHSAPTAWAKLACAVYSASQVALFGFSALYHRRNWSPGPRAWMRRLDHASIYLLIAGTYTPMCMLALWGQGGEGLIKVIWGIAAAGILKTLFWASAPKPLSTSLYLIMGWTILPYWRQVSDSLGPQGVYLVLAGGVAYSVGALTYALKRPDPFPKVFGYHEIFHALTIIASICHFTSVYQLVRDGSRTVL